MQFITSIQISFLKQTFNEEKNMARPKTKLNLTPDQNEYLQSIVRSREIPHSRVQRAQIILKAAAGDNNKKISQDLGLCEVT